VRNALQRIEQGQSMTLAAEVIVSMQARINLLELECDAAAERAQQHQIDMQALRAKAGIAAYDDADEDALAERQHIRVQTMRDQIQRLGKELTATQLANEDLCAAVNRLWAENDRLTAQAKLHDEVTTNVGRNFRRVSDELFDRNQEILGLRDYNNRLLRANELLQTTVARSLREVE